MTRLAPARAESAPPPDVPGRGVELYVPASLRAHLAVASGEAEHRQVCVAFVKLSGTVRVIVDHGPDELLACLDTLAATVGAACASYGITWLESDIDADASLCTAGAPWRRATTSRESWPTSELSSAIEIGLPIRAGVHRGSVFAGDIGAVSRRTYAVIGDAVNLAARLTGRAQPGEVLATADVLDQGSDAVRDRPRAAARQGERTRGDGSPRRRADRPA